MVHRATSPLVLLLQLNSTLPAARSFSPLLPYAPPSAAQTVNAWRLGEGHLLPHPSTWYQSHLQKLLVFSLLFLRFAIITSSYRGCAPHVLISIIINDHRSALMQSSICQSHSSRARTLPSSAPRNLLTISANHESSLQRISFHIRLLVLQTAVMLLMAMLSAVMQMVVVVMVMMHVRFLAF
jgi:hypothetical protein